MYFTSSCCGGNSIRSGKNHQTRPSKLSCKDKTISRKWTDVHLIICAIYSICRTKTPILVNGNMTYRLTHSRYTPVSSNTLSTTTSTFPPAAKSAQLNEPSTAEAAASNTTPSATALGFSRDHTLGNQIRQVIGDGEWNRQVITAFF